jgi:hypothetical protein
MLIAIIAVKLLRIKQILGKSAPLACTRRSLIRYVISYQRVCSAESRSFWLSCNRAQRESVVGHNM